MSPAPPVRRRPEPAIRDQKRRDALDRAYRRARTRPCDPDSLVDLAKELADAGQARRVFRHLSRAIRLAPPDWGGLSRVGEVFFRIGQHRAAIQFFERAQSRGCLSARSHRTYAALLHAAGETQKARRMLALSALMQPVTPPSVIHKDRLQVLSLRCFDNSHYRLDRNRETDLWSRTLSRGHFSLKNLLPRDATDLHFLSAWGESLHMVDTVPAVDLVINSIACADLNRAQLQNAAAFLKRFPDLPVINPPDRVLATSRRENSLRLSSIDGVRFPRTETLTAADDPAQTLQRLDALQFDYPLILRVAGTQTGVSVDRVASPDDARAYFATHPPGTRLIAIEYIDLPDDEGLYRKSRCFFIGGRFYPVASLVSDHWQIHSGDRYRVMNGHTAAQDRERAYLADPEATIGSAAMAALHAIAAQIGLDFMGIDFCLDRDGNVVVFEANAAMRHNFDHVGAFPYTRPYLETVSRAFAALVRNRRAGLVT
jgi:glutathione synthase/RimK-type ligase-like ATP-grasp enzyme